ncbi:hypothetical protein F4827_005060 [Paraburkholderia bannensis]|uniref:Uncharacterized protein n=1 Tax=Paraburkholderia bannensis TaxID=765414 RepID=A0A7W9WV07_9BURK|nr:MULTISPECIES: hypothetical protein [Paraburkholderia]MBB3259988.1 hypothetical protein [Paraburkholderia sp. WP4_3_2]MBB6105194.1 hypothetical protein [Paraburkholderia bannensis]
MKLEDRLINWARCQRVSPSDAGGMGLTANIYFRDTSVPGRTIDASLDVEDAHRIEVAMRRIMPMDRQLLQMHFVWRKPPFVICRRLGLRVRPMTVFDLALAHAVRAIENQLTTPKREFVSMQAIIDRIEKKELAETK